MKKYIVVAVVKKKIIETSKDFRVFDFSKTPPKKPNIIAI
jgi:hypothetical protein